MLRIVFRSMASHKRRLIGTSSAIILGVAFLAGTLLLGDTMRASFSTAFAQANAGISVVVQGSTSVATAAGEQRAPVPESVVGEVAKVDGVDVAVPTIDGAGQIVGSDGKPIGGQGPPTFAQSWIDDPELTTARITSGVAPAAAGEIVINEGAATVGNLKVGDKTTVLVPQAIPVTIVGIASFGVLDSSTGLTFAAFTFDEAQKLFGTPGNVSTILIQGAEDVTEDELVSRISPLLPSGVEAITGEQLTANQEESIQQDFLGLFETFLLVFAGVALVVATFSIYNTFSVIVAQRARESALLRAIGASRSQVLRSITVEALFIGVIASAIGVVLGGFVAAGLIAALGAGGLALPNSGLVVESSSVIWSVIIGIVVTVVASIAPAVRASRVPPLAALRETDADTSASSRKRQIFGFVLLAVGLVLIASPLFAKGDGVLARAGLGAVATFIGFIVVGPVVVGLACRVIGWPIAALRGVSGQMARGNSVRNPKRTANTATALMIGVCIVTLITVFGASIKASVEQGVAGSIKGELIFSSDNFSGTGYSPEMTVELDALPEVAAAAGFGQGAVLTESGQQTVEVVDVAALPEVLDVDTIQGSLTDLDANQIVISNTAATDNGWTMGTKIPMTTSSGKAVTPQVGAIIEASDLLQDVIVPRALWDTWVPQSGNILVLIALAPGVSVADAQAPVDAVGAKFGAGDALDKEEYVQQAAGQIDQLLNIVYVLLILAIIIALMGISNTLSLSVFERTRELGLLRAVGQTRPQTRSMVRWESVIIAVFGTLGGLILGALLGWAMLTAISAQESFAVFALPYGQLVIIAVVGALAGVLAGLRPAFRASKLNILAAISQS
ncbi:MAG: FtsX-like permease family protein [Candidatus Nanopelagicales bacterium]